MSKKGLTPKRRFPEFRGKGDWALQELGPKTTKVGSGITPTGGEKVYKKRGRPFIRSQNVGWSELLLDDVAYIDEETHGSFVATELRVDDVLLNITGASIGRSAIADSRIAGGNVNQHVCIIRVKPGELHPVLLNQYLVSHDGQKQIDSFQAGGNRQGLNFAQIRSLGIPLPPTLDEQQKIADCLSSLDELIAAERRKWKSLQTYKKGLMQHLFPRDGETTPRLRFPEFRDSGEWEQTNLEKLVDIQSGGTPSKSNPDFWNGSIPWVSAKDMKQLFLKDSIDHISEEAIDDGARVVPKGTLLILTRGMTLLKDVPICVLQREMTFNQHVKALRPKEGVEGLFLAFLLIANKDRLLTMVDVAGHGTGKLDTDGLRAFELVIPQPAEQQRIADCLVALYAQSDAEFDKLDAIKTHKKGIMQQLFPSPAKD